MRYLRWLAKYTRRECRFLLLTLRTSLYLQDLPRKLQGLPKVHSEWRIHQMLPTPFFLFPRLFEILPNCPEDLNVTFCLTLHRKILLPAQCFRCCDFCCHQDRSVRLEGFMISDWGTPILYHTVYDAQRTFVCAVTVLLCSRGGRFRLASCDQFWCRSVIQETDSEHGIV